jgi:hypothetical protein
MLKQFTLGDEMNAFRVMDINLEGQGQNAMI